MKLTPAQRTFARAFRHVHSAHTANSSATYYVADIGSAAAARAWIKKTAQAWTAAGWSIDYIPPSAIGLRAKVRVTQGRRATSFVDVPCVWG